jgi:hypothetical protein
MEHYINLAKKIGRAAVSRGIQNLARWDKAKHPDLASKAKALGDRLKKSTEWNAIGGKKAAAHESVLSDVEKGKIEEKHGEMVRITSEGPYKGWNALHVGKASKGGELVHLYDPKTVTPTGKYLTLPDKSHFKAHPGFFGKK